ncbi:MAG: hypothetical protein JNL62_29430 [Bryobacterales bacterium]|nr:hypothetical protein [Bryobacterales bacterium]
MFPFRTMFRGEVDQFFAARREWERVEVKLPLELRPGEGAFLTPAIEPLEESANADEVKMTELRFV